MNSVELIEKELNNINFEKLIEDINIRREEIPFGNSAFQNTHQLPNREITKGRASGHCLKRLTDRVETIRNTFYTIQIEDTEIEEMQIDIEELEFKNKEENNNFQLRRNLSTIKKIKLEIDKKLSSRPYSEKLIKDAVIEVNTLYTYVKSIPMYTREQFEAEELEHFELTQKRDLLGIKGARMVLQNIGIDLNELKLEKSDVENIVDKIQSKIKSNEGSLRWDV